MGKRNLRKVTLIVLFTIFSQFLFPFVSVLADNTSILPPSDVAAQMVTPVDVKLTWSSVYGATGYNVYEITEGQLIFHGKTTTNYYNLNDLAEGSYQFVVSTLSSSGESGPSAPVSFAIVYPQMVEPDTLTNTIKNGNDIVLNWGASQYAEKYNVYEISADNEKSLVASVTNRTYTVSNAAEGQYTYAVSSVNSLYGESPLSTPINVEIVHPIMEAPTNFTYTLTNGSDLTLKWASVSFATNYNIYEIKDGEKTLISTVTGTTLKLTNVPAGEYLYEITSNSDRFGESAEGSQLLVTISNITMTAPANFKYTLQNVNDIVLSWDSVPYATSYKVYQIIDEEKVLKSTVTGTTIKYSYMPSGNYVYEVHSFSDRYGESAESSRVSVTVETETIPAPQNFNYKIQNGNDIVLSWEGVTNANSYKVYQIENGVKVLKSTVTGTSVTYTNKPEGEYQYEVYAYSTRFGESQDGSQLSFTLVHPTMEPPANVIQTINSATEFTLSWDAALYATSYKVYQIVDGNKVLKSTLSGKTVTYLNMAPGEYVYTVHAVSSRFGESTTGTQLKVTLNGEKMGTPTNLTYTITNGNDITLKWSAVQYANSYNIYQVIDGEKVLIKTITNTANTFMNASAGEYNYVVHSVSSLLGESPEGAEITFSLVHPTMESPNNFTAIIQNENDIKLTWESVPFADSYNVYEIINGEKELKKTVTSLATTFSKVSQGEHIYVVHSYSNRFGESAEGSKITQEVVLPTMESPNNFTAIIQNGNDVKLTWESVPFADSYNVYEIINGEKELKRTVTTLATTFSKVSEGEHIYVVHSYSNRFGESTEGSKITQQVDFPTMEAPNNFTTSIQNGNDIKLTWESVPFADNYKVYEIINGEKELLQTVTTLTTTLSKVSEGEHTYIIHSVSNRFGESPKGSEVTQQVDFPTMEAPNNLTVSIQNGSDIKLTWESVLFANNYKVYEMINGEKELLQTVTTLTTTLSKVSEGKHIYIVHSYSNRFGESPEGSEITQNVGFPNLEKPDNLTITVNNGNDIYLKWNKVEFATNYRVYQVIDGEKVLQKTLTGTAVTFTNLPEGDYEYIVHSNSSLYGESIEGSAVSLTLVHPIMEKPDNLTSTIKNGNDIVLKWNASTYATAYNVYRINEGKAILEKTVTGTSISFTNMPEGDYTYVVHSYSNRFGESPEGSSINFTLTWPIVEPPQVTGTVFNANNIKLSWPAATLANEYRVYKITNGNRELLYKGTARTFSIYNLTEDTHTIEVTSFNTRFGESEPNQITEMIVYPIMEPPVATLSLLSETSARISWNFVTYANGYNIYELLDGQPVLVAEKVNNLSYTITNMSYANHEYYVTSYSNSFGESKQSNVVLAKLIVDTEPPVTNIDAPVDWTNEEAVVTLTATDNETGVANTYYSINDSTFVEGTTFSLDKEGVHKVSFYSVDKVGNTEEVKVIEVKIDKTAPVTTTEVPTTWSKEAVNVKLNTEDNLSGAATTFYSINGSEYKEGTSFEVTEEGINKITYYSVDHAGNKEELQTVEVKIDKTAPETTTEAPTTWSKEAVNVKLNTEDNLSGVATTFYSINGSEYQEGTSFEVTEEGINKITYYSVDHAGNKEELQTVEVKIDKTAPEVSWEIEDEYALNTLLTLNYSSVDHLSGVQSEVLLVNGTPFEKGAEFKFDKPGKYLLQLTVVDNAGWITTIEKTITVYIPVNLKVNPQVINQNTGKFTAQVSFSKEFEEEYGKKSIKEFLKGFDLKSATLEGVAAIDQTKGDEKKAEIGHFKFNREDFNWKDGEIVVEFRGMIGDYLVIGYDTIQVKQDNKKNNKK